VASVQIILLANLGRTVGGCRRRGDCRV